MLLHTAAARGPYPASPAKAIPNNPGDPAGNDQDTETAPPRIAIDAVDHRPKKAP